MWSHSQAGCSYQVEECMGACLLTVSHPMNTVACLLRAEPMLWGSFHSFWERIMAPPSAIQRRTRISLLNSPLHHHPIPLQNVNFGKPGSFNNGVTQARKTLQYCLQNRIGWGFGEMVSELVSSCLGSRCGPLLYDMTGNYFLSYKIRSLDNITPELTVSCNVSCLCSEYYNFYFI